MKELEDKLQQAHSFLWECGSVKTTFRELFDPYCTEYENTDDSERYAIIRELQRCDISIALALRYFKNYYRSINRSDIASSGEKGVVRLVEAVMLTPFPDC